MTWMRWSVSHRYDYLDIDRPYNTSCTERHWPLGRGAKAGESVSSQVTARERYSANNWTHPRICISGDIAPRNTAYPKVSRVQMVARVRCPGVGNAMGVFRIKLENVARKVSPLKFRNDRDDSSLI